jgi:hypothetical protein
MNTDKKQRTRPTGADIVTTRCQVGIRNPGAKIDKVFNTLVDSSIQTVVCRHEHLWSWRLESRHWAGDREHRGDPVIALGGAVLWLTWWQRNKA